MYFRIQNSELHTLIVATPVGRTNVICIFLLLWISYVTTQYVCNVHSCTCKLSVFIEKQWFWIPQPLANLRILRVTGILFCYGYEWNKVRDQYCTCSQFIQTFTPYIMLKFLASKAMKQEWKEYMCAEIYALSTPASSIFLDLWIKSYWAKTQNVEWL